MSTHATNVETINHGAGKSAIKLRTKAGTASPRDVLEQVVAGYIDTAMAVRQVQWNLGASRIAHWHGAMDQLYGDIDGHAVIIAERLAALGTIPAGTVQALAANTSMAPFPNQGTDANKLFEALAIRLEQLATLTRRAIKDYERGDDPVTVHYLTTAAAVIEKHLWMVESQTRQN